LARSGIVSSSEADIAPAFLRAEGEQVMAVLVEGDPITLNFGGFIIDVSGT
jgi:hypothetical protein